MKNTFSILTAFVFSISLVLTVNTSRAQGSVSFQVFYDQLSPYGSWVNYNQYGYVWIPTSVSVGFRPYGSSGHWVFTEDGWTWISDYSWGWAPFHYGNWFYDDGYGWMWIPGYDWAPAWVTWGEYGGNYGWAPIGPNIQIGAAWNSYRPPAYYWTFMPRGYMTRSNMSNYYVHYNSNVTFIKNITVINNINSGGGRPQYMRGPQASHVEKYTHVAIRPVTVRESAKPGRDRVQNGQVAIYRPTVSRAPAARPVAPARVQSLQAVKPAALPGYNHNVRPNSKPAPGNAARPAAPRPAGRSEAVTPKPNPVNRPARPAPGNHAPASNRPVPNNHPVTPSVNPRSPAPNNHPAASNHPVAPHQQAPTPTHPENRPLTPQSHQPARTRPSGQNAPRNIPHNPAPSGPAPRPPGRAPVPQQPRTAPQPVPRNAPAGPEARPPERNPR
ncbi:MAG: hypothetical protein Q8918_09705 [Bacteroidota bacterium]|nr:hypothetical protein [Bacteroidota bacterium]